LKELSLHILDIAENSVSAKATRIVISVIEDTTNDRLRICVSDNGTGMSLEMIQKVRDPFTTSRTTRKVGLGIPLLESAAQMCDGFLDIESTPGLGTKITVEFKRSHIDRMPLGDLPGTFLDLLIGCPEINWVFNYRVDEQVFELDDRLIKKELEDISLSEPTVLSYLRKALNSGFDSLQPEINIE
jgi:hypothetical protein